MRTTVGQMGPAYTPPIIKNLIISICSATIVAALLDPILRYYFNFSLQFFLSLTPLAYSKFFFWQPITYLFLLQSAGGLTFGLLLSLFFQMFLLWMTGSQLAERYGAASFLKLFFGTGVTAALVALPFMMATPFTIPYSGPTASLIAVFVVWTYLHHDSQILLFFIIPIKAKWLLAFGLGAAFLVFASNGSLISLVMLVTGVLFGALYATFFKELPSPYPFLESFDRLIAKLRNQSSVKGSQRRGKIFDFKTGKPVETDEEFLDRVLEKISRSGEDSLTPQERARLEKIARK